MGLRSLATWSITARPHALIVQAPGSFHLRVAAEQAIDAAGWCQAETVADADVLLVTGSPGPEMGTIIDHTWSQMSQPRARIQIGQTDSIEDALKAARDALTAPAPRPAVAAPSSEHHDEGHNEDHGDHGDHDAMSPGGIALAEGADDRDGLEMDELHLPLGPVLTHWPVGLVLDLTLNGDVVTAATATQIDSPARAHRPDPAAERAARLLDAAASLLSLAGMPALAGRARGLRDLSLIDPAMDAQAVDDLAKRLLGLRTLRWLWRKTTMTNPAGQIIGLHDRLVTLVEDAAAALRGHTSTEPAPSYSLEDLAELVQGQELATVRLWVAAWGVDMHLDSEQESTS